MDWPSNTISAFMMHIKPRRSEKLIAMTLVRLGHYTLLWKLLCDIFCSSNQALWQCCVSSKISQSLATYVQPAGALTYASCATASLAGELMVVLKEELIYSTRLEIWRKLLPRASDDAQSDLINLCSRVHGKQSIMSIYIHGIFTCPRIFVKLLGNWSVQPSV